VIFFLGMGVSGLLIASTSGVWSLAAALTLMGVFSAIYHPVGIPMLVQGSRNPGFTIGVNGLFGNLGIAVAAILTGFVVKHLGWRAAFAVPGGLALICAALFALLVPRETEAPARRPKKSVDLPRAVMARVLAVMTLGAISSSLIFNFTTNGKGPLLPGGPARRGRRPRHARRAARGGLHDRVARAARRRQAHRSLPAQVGIPADRGGPGAAVPARGARGRLAALRGDARVHGVRV